MTVAEPLVLVNGSPDLGVSPMDRGLAYGDGVFRTLRLEGGEPRWWPDHLAKLADDCRQLGMAAPERTALEQDLAWIGARMPDAVVRLSVTRGTGPRGYCPPELSFPTRIATASPLPTFPDPVLSTGACLRVCQLRLSQQPRLAGIKHLNRLENVLARMEWTDPDIDEGLLLDQEGWVISGVMSNLLVKLDGEWLTPVLDRNGVAGVARARLLARWPIRETRLDLAAVHRSDAVLLMNSLVQLRWVARLEGRTWSRPEAFATLRELLCSEN